MDAEYKEDGQPALSPEDVIHIKALMGALEMISEKCYDPIDPKVSPLLSVAYGLLKEQLVLDKNYTTSEAVPEDEFLDDTELTMSEEELWKSFEGDIKDDPPMPGPE